LAELVSILKALADETRFKLVNLLLKQDYCVGGLAIRLNISESAISQHLKVLRDAGIVKGDKRGYYTHYYVDQKVLKEAADQIIQLSRVIPVNQDCYYDCPKGDNPYSCNKHRHEGGESE